MVGRELPIGAISQILLIAIAITAILPPILLGQTFFYISCYFLSIASVFNYRFLYLTIYNAREPDFLHFQLPSLLGILNSLLFLVLIFLLLILIRRIGHKIGTNNLPKRSFSFGFALAILAGSISILFNTISLNQVPYWTSETSPYGSFLFVWGLDSLGWVLLILENLLVGLTMISFGFVFIIVSKHFTLNRLWISTGLTYVMAGVFDFTIFATSIGLIFTIVAGFMGLGSFYKTDYIEVNV